MERQIINQQNKTAFIEAVLFMTTDPLNIEEIQKTTKIRKDEIEAVINILKEKFSSADHGITVSDIGGFRFIVKPEFVERVAHLTPHADLSRGLLRVLSIIVYHEPINQSDIVKVVGNRAYDYVKELEEKGLIKSEKKSRTKILKTTPKFEEYFGMKKNLIKKEFEELKDEKSDNESGSAKAD